MLSVYTFSVLKMFSGPLITRALGEGGGGGGGGGGGTRGWAL